MTFTQLRGRMDEVVKFSLPVVLAILAWWLKLSREQSTVGRAIYSEIMALTEITRHRHFLQDLRVRAEFYRSDPSKPAEEYRISVADHYCRVYAGNIQNIGCLDAEQAALIVRFYQLADSVVRDVSQGGQLYQGTNDPCAYEENALLLEQAMQVAENLKMLRERQSNEPWYLRCWKAVT
ncbi:hypothetical protein HRJ41_14925 [Pseudomonas sp. BF61]|nr:hypothetical protein [Pseudomonas sp. MF6768]MBU4628771.1 hypothetical protein [Pseudomonas sp. BF61]QXH87572.1 hypothetical protein HU773_018005 [Pseudomonas shahriarae]